MASKSNVCSFTFRGKWVWKKAWGQGRAQWLFQWPGQGFRWCRPGAERPPGVGRRTLGVQVMAGTRRLGSHRPASVLWMEASPEAEEQMGLAGEGGFVLRRGDVQ